MEYLIVIEKNDQSHYCAWVPDLPGCVSIGDTMDELKNNIKEAIELHLEGLRRNGYTIPVPNTEAFKIAV